LGGQPLFSLFEVFTVLGFVGSTATETGFGIPTETKMSQMKTDGGNNGLVAKGESLGADAIINVRMSTSSRSVFFFLQATTIYVKWTAIKFN